MSKKTPLAKIFSLPTLILALTLFTLETNAQYSVWTTETLAKGETYVELNSSFKPNNQGEARRFSSFLPRVAHGVTRDFEVGVLMLGNVQPGADETTVSPMLKYRVYKNEKHAVSVSVGTNFYIPVKKRAYNFGSQVYAQATKTFAKTGTRVTAGSFVFTKNVAAEKAARGGVLMGVEQPITKRFGLAADWLSGKHDFGYATYGFYFRPTKRAVSYIGYSVGNSGAKQGNHYVFANIGFSIP